MTSVAQTGILTDFFFNPLFRHFFLGPFLNFRVYELVFLSIWAPCIIMHKIQTFLSIGYGGHVFARFGRELKTKLLNNLLDLIFEPLHHLLMMALDLKCSLWPNTLCQLLEHFYLSPCSFGIKSIPI